MAQNNSAVNRIAQVIRAQ